MFSNNLVILLTPKPMSPVCPWSGFEPPTIQFCEAILCAWITQPANTWSNLAYLFVGIWLIRKTSTDQESNTLQLIGILAIAVGIASFAYHASYTRIAQFFDLSSMYFFSSLLLVLNLRRLKLVKIKTQIPVFLGVNLLSMVILAFFKSFGQAIFGIQVILALLLEAYIFRSQENKPNYRELIWALLFFIVAFIIWILDVTKILCNPNNHFLQGHAIWHILTSFCFLFLYRFYRQFQFKS